MSSGYFGDTVPTFELEVNIFLGGGAVFFCLRCVLSFGWGTLLDAVSKVQVTVPSINYQTTQIPFDLIEHYVKRLGLGDTFNAIQLSVLW